MLYLLIRRYPAKNKTEVLKAYQQDFTHHKSNCSFLITVWMHLLQTINITLFLKKVYFACTGETLYIFNQLMANFPSPLTGTQVQIQTKCKKTQMSRIISLVTEQNCTITALNLYFWRREKLVLEENRAETGLLKYSLHR